MTIAAIQTFNASLPVELQLTDFSCSVGATFWCLQSLGVSLTQQQLQDLMVPGLVSPDLGLLDSSGATIAQFLHDHFGLAASNASEISFDDLARRAGQQPVAIGGRRWHINPDGSATGHWVAVRSFDGTQLTLANPGGTGPNFGQQSLSRDDFQQRGTFAAVWIDLPGAAAAARKFRIGNTSGQGANLRSQPSTTASPITLLAEGTELSGGDHAWRQVTDANGNTGWVADEFLVPER